MNVIKRMDELMRRKGLTEYQLAKKANLSLSTIMNIKSRNTVPSFSTLEHICDALEISMSQFFADENTEPYPLTRDQKKFVDNYILLPKEIQDSLTDLVVNMNARLRP